jgi:ABC-type nitrate/sulfonate/bicarbonate transport system permease component
VSVIATLAILAGVWYWTSTSSNYLVVPLGDMLGQFRETWLSDNVTSDLLPTLRRMILGFLLAVGAGVGLGLLIGLVPVLHELTSPIVGFLRAIPPVALLPPAIVILGIGDVMRVFLIAFVCIWPVLLNVADGIRDLDRTMLDAARAYRINGWFWMRTVLLPALGPRAFAGMRTSLSFAVIMAVTSEMVAATNGVGTFLVRAQQGFQMPHMWATIIVIGLIGFLLNSLFILLERRVLRWHHGATASNR